MPPSAGDHLGPFEILSPVGAGGMGEVWKARDTRLNRIVAIKFLKGEHGARFEQEARAIAALNHPHICQIHDIGPDYLVLEYIEGVPLKGPLATAEALRLALQITGALEVAHKHGILHRDLKPANILVTESGAKLVDFGLAKLNSVSDGDITRTQEGMLLGTAAYMSPEQAQGQAADARSDIFSFGVLLYEMLSGRRAFSGNSMLETLNAVIRFEPPTIESPIASIVRRCMAKQPSQRYQSMAEVRCALEKGAMTQTVEQSPSIAVLPFSNLSSDKDNEYFSDGLAEEILNALTGLPALRVIARASAFSFRQRENAIAEIGQKLQVTNVLCGSVRRAGNRIRVSAQLIKVCDESQLWSERYDREMADVFDIQDEIARAIVAQLKIKLGPRSDRPLVKRYTENLEAHSLYLKGNFHYYRFTPEEMAKGLAYLEQAVALEPDHAPALFNLADVYIGRAHFGKDPAIEMWPKARAAFARARDADPEFVEADAALGYIEAVGNFHWEDGLRALDDALRANPRSARAHFWRGGVLHCMGRTEEGLEDVLRATELDPMFTVYHVYASFFCLQLGKLDRAAEHARHALEIDPDYGPRGLMALGEAYSLQGRHEEGIACIERGSRTAPGAYIAKASLAFAYVRGGRRSDAERLRAELEETRPTRYISPGALAFVAAALDDVEAAFRYAEEAVAAYDPNFSFGIRTPYVQLFRSDPRYRNILRRMNLER
jgi:serine/threonine-protein kinase